MHLRFSVPNFTFCTKQNLQTFKSDIILVCCWAFLFWAIFCKKKFDSENAQFHLGQFSGASLMTGNNWVDKQNIFWVFQFFHFLTNYRKLWIVFPSWHCNWSCLKNWPKMKIKILSLDFVLITTIYGISWRIWLFQNVRMMKFETCFEIKLL